MPTTPMTPLARLRDTFTPAGPPTPLFGHSPRRFVRRLPYAVAILFVAILLPVTTMFLGDGYHLDADWALVLALFQVLPLLFAVRRPLVAWAVAFTAHTVCAAVLLGIAPGPNPQPWPWTPMGIIGMLLLLLAVGLRERNRTLIAVWTLTGAVSAAFQFIAPGRSNGSWVALFVLGGVLLVIGGLLRERAVTQRALAEQETISEAERSRRTLLEERARIARELHDVVAHHMSVITVQADSAPYRVEGLPDAAREEFASIAATARESLTEMRRLLGVLRNEDTAGAPGTADRTPQPGVERIPQLIEATVRAGVPVELSMPGLPALPQAVDLSAYRITQEALANVVRHAPGAATRVSLSLEPDGTGLVVLVVNAAPERDTPPLETGGTGHGLVGMRERVRLVGGTLDTGPLPEGGFRVAARLPLRTEEESSTA
ncbi:sensor histidine kinase [Streptomyces abikoensis]|uniref:sensor histidine kinase n=1 Tax=Streptomyces abikoensis TaxID=97398 RepID=UPI001679B0B3|nr:sensor histidine kinase [Streptomyces abikoensis]GGP56310.1 two-component sensor histidine kinase [Streptomyces abikoensis]